MTIKENFATTSHPCKSNLTNRQVNIITMGCSKNRVDSEQAALQLQTNGFRVTHESSAPLPITLVNTCGFIADAKEQSIEAVMHCVAHKNAGKIRILIIFGCLSERYRADLRQEIPEADAVFGVNAVEEILRFLHARLDGERLTVRQISTPKHYAYLKISEGCSHRCAFCAIPNIRGRQVSKPLETIKEEAMILASQGVKELILVAQDLTHYGYDIYRKRNLADLLDLLCDIDSIEWIRLHYAYPNTFQTDVLEALKRSRKLCRYLDIPIQHIHDEMLTAMHRKITSASIIKLLDKIKNGIPEIALRTSLIVGFPGETQKHFRQMADFVKQGWFDRLGVFSYSHEEGTAAYKLKDNVSKAEKQARMEQIMEIQYDISYQKNRNKVGKTYAAIIDECVEKQYICRTEYDSPEIDNTVIIQAVQALKIGHFYPVKITHAEAYDLYGEVQQPL